MKTLNKKEFIPFLKNISEVLDKEEIEHELPFCHIDKDSFNHMFIIIPDQVTAFDIGEYFNCIEIKEKNGIVRTNIDDFLVNFVKSRDVDWVYTLYYYSWNIIPVLVDILVSKSFGLRYTRTGLKYQYKEKLIDISKNMKDIFDFLELKFHLVINGFPTEYVMFEFIEASPYYDTEYFTEENFKKFDPYYEFNKQYYKNLIKHKPEYSGEKKTIDEQIIYIDACFPQSNFLEKLSKIQIKEEYPDLKERPIYIRPEQKTIEELAEEKRKEVRTKKINLRKIVDNKKDDDFNFNIE